MKNEYYSRVKEHEAVLCKDKTNFNLVGNIKLVLILAMAFLVYLMFARSFPLHVIALFAVFLVALIILWVYHNRLYDRMNYTKGQITICNHQIDRITGKWVSFADSGQEFCDREHVYANDLDVVGYKSLFQLLNITNTWHGRRRFVNDLLHADYTKHETEERQRAVAELNEDIDFFHTILYQLTRIKEDSSAESLVNELKDKTPFTKSKHLKYFLLYLPVLTLVLMSGVLIFRQNNLYPIALSVLVVQAIVWIAGGSKIKKYIGTMKHLPYKLSDYNNVINILLNKTFVSEKLNRIKAQLEPAAIAIKELGKVESKLSIRSNGLIYFILNVILWWDYECAIQLGEWKKKYADMSESWFLTIGEFESLLCFSNLPNVCENTSLPTVFENAHEMDVTEMGHPLIPNEVRIDNSFNLNNRILIISGSNMSGKTTFLRTVGVNLILARTGSFVCAKRMSCSLLNPMTSMRISDDLCEGISTFYAELKRIKKIVDFADSKKNLIFLIDEIFKGTNSSDRIIGAKTVIERLNNLGVVGLLSTHDLELCVLANEHTRIGNYHFSEYYENSEIRFDYKLKTGKSNTTNAEYLMKMVGIT